MDAAAIGLVGVLVGALIAGVVALVVAERQAQHANHLAHAADRRAVAREAYERLRQLWSRQVRLTRLGVNRELWSLTALSEGNTQAAADLLVTKGLDEDDWDASLIGDPALVQQFIEVVMRPHEPGVWPTMEHYVALNVLRMRIARALDDQEEAIANGLGPQRVKPDQVVATGRARPVSEEEFLSRPQRRPTESGGTGSPVDAPGTSSSSSSRTA